MKRLYCLLMFCVLSVFAEGQNIRGGINAYDNIVLEIPGVGSPYEVEGAIVFTADASARFCGIAFDFEGYRTIHPFRKRTTHDMDGNATGSLLFYILERPSHVQSLSYRLIIDGLWTTDPNNPDRYYDEDTGTLLSRVTFRKTLLPTTTIAEQLRTEQGAGGTVRFIYRGAAGQRIYLAGTFTNWDPWIYELKESSRGFYELSLPLPAGTYYYNFYIGMNAHTDPTNPQRVYTSDGRRASVIVVN